jgi:hypothetical protein
MKDLDPSLVIYSVVGVIIVFGTFLFLAAVTEGVKSLNAKVHQEDRKKREEQRKRKAA